MPKSCDVVMWGTDRRRIIVVIFVVMLRHCTLLQAGAVRGVAPAITAYTLSNILTDC